MTKTVRKICFGAHVTSKLQTKTMITPIKRLFCLCAVIPTVVGFPLVLQSRQHKVSVARHSALHVAASQGYAVEAVEGGEKDPRVLDVAAFRNGMVNPEMMVERAKNKRDSIDNTAAAVNGLKIGLLYVGPVIGLFTYLESDDVSSALSNYAVLGGGIGALLAANNFLGRGVHVPDIPEATK